MEKMSSRQRRTSKEFFQNLNGIGYIFKLFCMEESFVLPEAVTEPLAKKSLAQF
jgi:hypothetical protein